MLRKKSAEQSGSECYPVSVIRHCSHLWQSERVEGFLLMITYWESEQCLTQRNPRNELCRP